MASQLNPAWQHKTVSSNHLANISAPFLSDGSHSESVVDGCQVIPFLLDNPEQNWIPHALCEVLTRRGHHSRLYQPAVEDDRRAPARLENVQQDQIAGETICLLPTTSPVTIQEGHFDHLVLLVPASLDAILTAYQQIKRLSQSATLDIGVVMVGPRDQHAAWRYFRKLAVGSLRYLDVPLLNLGFLPQQVLPEHDPSDQHRQNFLTRIGERLLNSGFHSTYHPADPAKTPVMV